MKYQFWLLLALLATAACSGPGSHRYTRVTVTDYYRDSVSIRAIELMPGALAMAGSDGFFGTLGLEDHQVRAGRQALGDTLPEFRAVAHTATDFFMLSAGSPALLYKTGDQGQMELVYREDGPEVFYDAMAFWDNREGMAVGDAQGGCLSILVTRDGGQHWEKLPCTALPEALNGEGAFAASNTNLVLKGDHAWVVSSRSRIWHSPDRGHTWEVVQTPAGGPEPTQGLYSLAFWDEITGYAIGGDYTRPDAVSQNKARTTDGGQSWELVADGQQPGYKSCVQYVPGAGGLDLVAVGFTGVSYSGDGGLHWQHLNDEPFYTLRFLNDSVAYAAGRGRVARLVFRQ
ncbi:oxidoreductase [Robiginitalea sp. M366]|uniref:WD40/YVTN/BNR-like repeat-containing protein n=1 Tax=Robiginitalea aestuariiviva TaxID=3036903 RepID=UPI00240E2E63|nr:YCF48-related protein [Robiginitalea aestuariiviva]MDG1573465.1 oxidoreductase [Robiginitalea aestuariiviva]